jgi:hypothetical protein
MRSDSQVEFEELAAEFTKSIKHDLADFPVKRSFYRRNIFYSVFLRLNEAAKPSYYSKSSKHIVSSLFEILMNNLKAVERLSM